MEKISVQLQESLLEKIKNAYKSIYEENSIEIIPQYIFEKLKCNLANRLNSKDDTLFHILAEYGKFEELDLLVKYILEKVEKEKLVDILNIKNLYGYTPLRIAKEKNYTNIVDYLKDQGAEIGSIRFKLPEDMKDNLCDILSNLYTEGNDKVIDRPLPDDLNLGSKLTDNGDTLLHLLADYKKFDELKIVLDFFKNSIEPEIFLKIINVKNDVGFSLLYQASFNSNLEIIEYLIKIGADVKIRTNYNSTPLHAAAMEGNLNTVKYFVEKQNLNVNDVDEDNYTTLHEAAHSGNLELVKYLIEKCNADIGVKTKFGSTILEQSICSGNLKLVKYLVEERGINVKEDPNYHNTLLYFAICIESLDLVKYLVEEHDENILEKIKNGLDKGKTPLQIAISLKNKNIINYLNNKIESNK